MVWSRKDRGLRVADPERTAKAGKDPVNSGTGQAPGMSWKLWGGSVPRDPLLQALCLTECKFREKETREYGGEESL